MLPGRTARQVFQAFLLKPGATVALVLILVEVVPRIGLPVPVSGLLIPALGLIGLGTIFFKYDGNPAHVFQAMLDPAAPPAPGDPARMATRIIDSVDIEPAPLRMVLGSQALASTLATLRTRVADFETQTDLAASTDYPAGD